MSQLSSLESTTDLVTVMYIVYIMTILSIISISLMMISYCMVPTLSRNTAIKMIFQLAISDMYFVMIGFLNYYTNYYETNENCYILGFFSQHAALVNPTWVFAFAFILYGFYTKRFTSSIRIKKQLPQIIAGCWLVPALIALIPLMITHGYGQSFLYCWVPEYLNTTKKLVLMSTILFIPVWVEISFIISYYYKINKSIKENPHNVSQSKELIQQLMYYPAGIILNVLFQTCDRVFNLGGTAQIGWIFYLKVFFKQGQGLISTIAYFSSPIVRKMIKDGLKARKKDLKGSLLDEQLKEPLNERRDTQLVL